MLRAPIRAPCILQPRRRRTVRVWTETLKSWRWKNFPPQPTDRPYAGPVGVTEVSAPAQPSLPRDFVRSRSATDGCEMQPGRERKILASLAALVGALCICLAPGIVPRPGTTHPPPLFLFLHPFAIPGDAGGTGTRRRASPCSAGSIQNPVFPVGYPAVPEALVILPRAGHDSG